jgi:hypothetical protein
MLFTVSVIQYHSQNCLFVVQMTIQSNFLKSYVTVETNFQEIILVQIEKK